MDIKNLLNKSKDFYDIEMFDVLESTNSTLKSMAKSGEKEGKVIVAQRQTKGRGKMNREFFSPEGSGIYMSILLKPDIEIDKAVLLTAMTAVAVAETIENVSGVEAKIKWVNDIYCKGKKVCGILTESGLELYSKKVSYSVIGIGINLIEAETGFPSEISNIAGTVYERNEYKDESRAQIIAGILESIYNYYLEFSKGRYKEKYKSRSNLLGKEIIVTSGESIKKAIATNIDDDCRLVVKYDDGNQEALLSGDVSVKAV
ncbi:MAG: biotin--[acetyl-CoA-carboxylase] ligase [Ruminococcaceae bacterium]|nr:biotin--[acetyl-CoA-carboxylase] ligase [Oscillospiraceae bacterium]